MSAIPSSAFASTWEIGELVQKKIIRTHVKRKNVNRLAVHELEKRNLVKPGDRIILTKGEYMGVKSGTDAMRILTVGDVP